MADLGKINQALNRRWWQVDPADKISSARALFSTVRLIAESQKSNTLQDMVHTRMYGGRRAISGLAFASAVVDNVGTVGAFGTFAQPNHNLIYSAITTINSKLTKEQPRIEVIPDGGDYLITRQAEKLQQYIDGLFYDCNTYAQTKMASKTALILGTGAVKLWFEDKRLCMGHVFTPNLHIDTVEGDSKNPRSVFQDGLMDRFLLARQFPEQEAFIMAAKPFTPAGGVAALIESNVNVLNSMVLVEEGWHLESEEGAGDGRHVLAIEGMTLVDEPWTLGCFPFVFFRFDNNPIGFYGRGVAELLTGHQRLRRWRMIYSVCLRCGSRKRPMLTRWPFKLIIPVRLASIAGRCRKWECRQLPAQTLWLIATGSSATPWSSSASLRFPPPAVCHRRWLARLAWPFARSTRK